MSIVADIVDPFPGRTVRALEITIVCMLVVLVSMTFSIPDPATSAYVVFFAAKDNAGGSIVANVALVLVVTIVVAVAFGLALLSLNSPEGRILLMATWSFVMFFMAIASKLASLASTIGLIVAYAIDLFGSAPLGEIATRGLLYAWLFVAMPMGVFFIYNLTFGRRPDVLAKAKLARRLRAVAALLGEATAAHREAVSNECDDGNEELFELLKMAGLFHFQTPAIIKCLRALSVASYNLVVAALAANEIEGPAAEDLAVEIETLASAADKLSGENVAPGDENTPPSIDRTDRLFAVAAAVADVRNVLAGRLPVGTGKASSSHAKSGFFRGDAFENPDYVRYALKGMTAGMICYLTFSLLDWPAIHTCMLTCFVVGLTTVGESTQKLMLRISGCLVGGAIGLLTIVYIMPQIETIAGLMLLIGAVTLPAAWVAVGRPNVAYIGFQAAFALYLCILQGSEPKFDLTIIRDRTIGILFGNLVIYVIFSNVYPLSVLSRVRDGLVRLLNECRDLLNETPHATGPFEVGERAAELQASFNQIERDAVTLGYESLGSERGGLQRAAIVGSLAYLRSVVEQICQIAVCGSLDEVSSDPGFRSKSLAADAQLAALVSSLGSPHRGEPTTIAHESAAEVQADRPLPDGFTGLGTSIDQLSGAISRYRDLLRDEADAHV